MRFGVLGPLAVWGADGELVRIPEVKVRALLADLIVHVGRAVSVDQLVDDLWGAALPANPGGALQIKVSRLRQALGAGGGSGVVVSRAPGYLLQVGVDAVDFGQFRELVAQARVAVDARGRAGLLRAALGLWRGAAFADFADEGFASAIIARLEEERLVAVEELVEARLELGEHRELVAELGDLVGGYPLRERLRAAQLRALYRSGRQSEALESYSRFREHLAEELGLDPSAELAALRQAILTQDPALHVGVAPVVAVPRLALPSALTELIGRETALVDVRKVLEAGRLVTLTGAGGVGKTRLAVETARQVGGTFADGVWLVELAALDAGTRVAQVAGVIAARLGIRDDAAAGLVEESADPVEQLTGALYGKQLLLVLDNCEHVVESVAKLSQLLLGAAPELRILATSQEPLGISGELLWTVPPLELPVPGSEPSVLAQFSAVQLFVARAAAAVPGFAVRPENALDIARICRRLDGIPLALELAATRVRALGVRELAERLGDRFRVLVSGTRGAPARQQTLRAMIDWSWELLPDAERTVLRRLAVPADGCTLEVAEQLCGGDGLDVLELVARLVDRSLVVMVEGSAGPRYRLLESVKAYSIERLQEAGEFEAIRQRHLCCCTEFAERGEPRLYGAEQREWLERFDAEAANLRGALDVAVQQQDADYALRLVNALAWYWMLRGRLVEARRCFELAVRVEGESPARASAMVWQNGIALLASAGGDPADRITDLKSFEDIDDPRARARAKWFLSFAYRGFYEPAVTTELVNQALVELEAVGDRWGIAAALNVRATLGRAQGELAAAKRDAEASDQLFRELGDRWGQLKATNTLGELAEISGDYALAARLHRDGLRMAEELGLGGEASFRVSGLGRIALLTGDFAAAEEYHQRARQLAIAQFNKVAEEFAEIGLALGARRSGKLDLAEAHLRSWIDWLRGVDGEPGLALALAELGFIAEQRGDAATALAVHLDGFAAAREIGDPRAVALAMEGLAGAQVIAGQAGRAAALLGAATALRSSVGAPLPAAERGDVERISAAARAALGEPAFSAEFALGGAADLCGLVDL